MRKILEKILKMPYYRNHQAVSGAVHNISKHEDAVRDVFVAHGLYEVEGKIKRAQRDNWLDNPDSCDMDEGTFIFQPCGQNDSPDFIVKLHGKAYFIECKSVKGSTKAPMYNSGVPKAGYIYVFTSERYNETTIYFGEDVCPAEDYENFQKLIQEHRRLDEEYNSKFTNRFGIRHYTRPMVTHIGGTDYFRNPHRRKIEKGVLSAV
jgi:hypothetical protein